MNEDPRQGRRRFLAGASGIAAAAAAGTGIAARNAHAAAATEAEAATACTEAPPAGYQSLSGDEAVFVEAMVDLMCPADDLTPSGTECGVATYIDRQLAGAFGSDYRLYTAGPWMKAPPEMGYQLPLRRDQWFKTGIAAAQAKCKAAAGKTFDRLSAAQQDDALKKIASGEYDDPAFSLGTWFNELAYPLFVQGCFADPVYGGNRDKVFWKLIGYPGLPATHGTDVVTFKGKRFPASANPKSIQDFS